MAIRPTGDSTSVRNRSCFESPSPLTEETHHVYKQPVLCLLSPLRAPGDRVGRCRRRLARAGQLRDTAAPRLDPPRYRASGHRELRRIGLLEHAEAWGVVAAQPQAGRRTALLANRGHRTVLLALQYRRRHHG